jgi:predicted nucleic acid-binding protein
MVKALFDTNILIDYLNAVPEARDELLRYEQQAISIITWMEVLIGARPEHATATRRRTPPEASHQAARRHHLGQRRRSRHAARYPQHQGFPGRQSGHPRALPALAQA